MKIPRSLPALLPLLLVLSAHEAAAQAERNDGPIPFVGFAVGISSLPRAFQACGDAGHLTGELRGGVAWGSLALEGVVLDVTTRPDAAPNARQMPSDPA